MTTLNRIATNIDDFCHTHHLLAMDETMVVAVSGGADSLCLLHWLKDVAGKYRLKLHVAHLNHQLRATSSNDDAVFVSNLAKSWHLPVTVSEIDVGAFAKTHKLSLEDAARQCRYRFLTAVAQEVGASKVAVAHNANDQAETLLMHLLRGTGLSGLRGMAPTTSLFDLHLTLDQEIQSIHLIRPLLPIDRADIETYCRAYHLIPRIDQSNSDQTFLRNRVRHELLPLLETYNPQIIQSLNRTADLLMADSTALQAEINRVWAQIVRVEAEHYLEIDLAQWRVLSVSVQRNILRKGITYLKGNVADISGDHIAQAITLLMTGQTGKQIHLPDQIRLAVHYDTASLFLADAHPPSDAPHLLSVTPVLLMIPGETFLPGEQWRIVAQHLPSQEADPSSFQTDNRWHSYFDAAQINGKLWLRVRQAGDTFTPLGLSGQSQSLKRFMINQKIRAAHRPHWPLLVDDQVHIHWVCGWRQSHLSRVTPQTQQLLRVTFERIL
ncbi:MAG: tRNA lysidine(34) synthetase TilS [Chloroflexota bacterium]